MKKAVFLLPIGNDSYYYVPENNTIYVSTYGGSSSLTIGLCMICVVVIELLSVKLKNITEAAILTIIFWSSNILWLFALHWQKKSLYKRMRPIFPLHSELAEKVNLIEINYRNNRIAVMVFFILFIGSIYAWINTHIYMWMWIEMACLCFLYYEIFINGHFLR